MIHFLNHFWIISFNKFYLALDRLHCSLRYRSRLREDRRRERVRLFPLDQVLHVARLGQPLRRHLWTHILIFNTTNLVLSRFLKTVYRVSWYINFHVSPILWKWIDESIHGVYRFFSTQPITKKAKMNRFTVLESQNRLSTRRSERWWCYHASLMPDRVFSELLSRMF